MKDSKYYKKMMLKHGKIKDNCWISKLLLSIIVVLSCLIVTNFDSEIRNNFNTNILEKNINFGYFKRIYNKFVGGKEVDDTLVVSLTNLIDYTEENGSYKVNVSEGEGIEVMTSGIIVYSGDKDNLGNTIIIQGNDGVDIWYSNVSLNGFSLYDYVSKGDIIGISLSDYYYFNIVKDGKKMKYEEYFG